jgi:2-oxoglutarate/2-oxoacid ferredoxin oxidoreductase subunit beta
MKNVIERPMLLMSADKLPLAFCPGCQNPTVGRLIAEVLEEMKVSDRTVSALGIGCNSFIGFMLDIDLINGPHGRAPDLATGAKRMYPENLVFTLQGDGDLLSIGAESLMGALARAEKITILMINNTVYGTTGGQAAPTTLVGQMTATTPQGKDSAKFGYPIHAAEMVAGFKGVAYSARGALNTFANAMLTRKYIRTAFERQLENAGLTFVEILTPCPTNWHMNPVKSLKWIGDTLIQEFPLGEFKNARL